MKALPGLARGTWSALALFLLPALAALLARGPWPLDETRLLQVVAELQAREAWMLPTLFGEPYTHKPPLVLWAVRLLALAGVELGLAARLFALLCALGSLLCLGRAARALDPEGGPCVAPALAATPFFLLLGQAGTYDAPLLFFLLALLASLAARPCSWVLPWLCMGLAILTKGHVALFYAVPWMLAVRCALLGRRALRPTWRLPAGLLLCLGLVALWLVPFLAAIGWEIGRTALVDQLLGRLQGDPDLGHVRPFHYYLVALPLLFLPWSWLLLKGLVQPAETPWRAWEKAVLGVALGHLILLSLAATKGAHYALPLLPWMLLLLPRALIALGGHGSQAWVLATPALGAAALLFAAGPFDGVLELVRPGLPALLAGARWPTGLAGAGLLLLPLLRSRLGPLALLSLLQLLVVLALAPILDRAQVPHAILRELSARPPRALLVFHERAGGSLSFLAARAGVRPPEPGLLPALPEGTRGMHGFQRPGVAAPSLTAEIGLDLPRILREFLLQPGTQALLRREFWERMGLAESRRLRIQARAFFRGKELLLLAGPGP